MFFNKPKCKCSNCGIENDKKNKYCSQCGSTLSEISCSSCGMQIRANYKFCPKCGATMAQIAEKQSKATPSSEGVWQRSTNDFAQRFEVRDIKGFFSKKITVMSGTKAIFLQGGKFFGELPPGTYTVGGLTQVIKNLNISEKAIVILVDDSDVGLDFNISGLRSKENFDAGIKGKVVINLEEPIQFFNNMMKNKEHIAATDIEVMLRNEMRNLLQSKIKQHSFEDLYGNLELKKELEQDFEHLLNITLSRVGLKFVYMPYFDYDESYWKDIIEAQGESARELIQRRERVKQDAEMQLVEYEQRIAAKKKKLEFEKEDYEIDSEGESLEEKRLKLTKLMRARLTDDKMDEFQNIENLEKFLYDIDKDKVIRTNEMFELKQIFEENREDREFTRKMMMKRVEQRHALDMDAEQRLHELEMRQKEDDYIREKERREDEADARAAREGLDLLKQMKASKREDVAGYQSLEIEKMQKEAELEEQKLKSRSTASDEALISMVGGKESEHLSELARMKLATKLTDEQILALGAKDSAAVAEAFKEKYKSKSAEETMRIYEDRLDDRDSMLKTIQEMSDKSADRIERVAAKGLEQMGTTAATRAAQGTASGSTTVVTGGGIGQPVIIGDAQQPSAPQPVQEVKKVVICTECNMEMPVGTMFCTNCGTGVGNRSV